METKDFGVRKNSDGKRISVSVSFPYSKVTELTMGAFYQLLSERNKRLYAANEALRLGYGGISYIASVLGCDRKTIYRGIAELKQAETIEKERVRAKGGGRKISIDSIP